MSYVVAAYIWRNSGEVGVKDMENCSLNIMSFANDRAVVGVLEPSAGAIGYCRSASALRLVSTYVHSRMRSNRKSIHSYVILRNVRFSSETPPLRKISVRYVRNIRSKNVTFAVVLRRYRMKVLMFFTKHVSTWQA